MEKNDLDIRGFKHNLRIDKGSLTNSDKLKVEYQESGYIDLDSLNRQNALLSLLKKFNGNDCVLNITKIDKTTYQVEFKDEINCIITYKVVKRMPKHISYIISDGYYIWLESMNS